jgi:cystathionine beta-lyase
VTFEVQDVPAIARVAHAHGAAVVLDNTWGTPLRFRSFAHGVDVSVHAATKAISGHSDVLIGVVVCNEATHARVKATWTDLGMSAGPDDCYAALRGLRTLSVRLERQEASALRIAQWLRAQPEVAEVIHPPLPGSRGHALWRRDFSGGSGLFALILRPGPRAAVAAMLDGLERFGMGYSWGGFESLVMVYDPVRVLRALAPWAPGGPHLRLSIGLEDVDELIADLRLGLDRYRDAGDASA